MQNKALYEYANGVFTGLGSFSGWGNTPRAYSEYEIIIQAATVDSNGQITIKKDGVTIKQEPFSISNITGGMRIDITDSGSVFVGDLRAYNE